MNRRSVYFVKPGTVEVRDEPMPAPGPQQLLVESLVSAVSAGTELLVYRGQMPSGMVVDETIGALAGTFAYPLKYGYATVGQVVDVGAEVSRTWLGRRVFAFNPHESHFVVAPEDGLALPEDVGPETAIFLPTMETAVSFVMDGRPMIGEQVAIVGQGIVGLLTVALLAGFPLSSLVTLDAIPLRRQWSEKMGAITSLDPAQGDILAQTHAALREDRPYEGADLVYELSGNPEGLDLAIGIAGYNGRIVAGSWYGNKQAALDLGGRFHRSHMQIISSQVSHIAPQWSGRWTKPRRLDVAWEKLRSLQPERLITHRLPLDQAAEAYRLLDRDSAETLQVVLTYSKP